MVCVRDPNIFSTQSFVAIMVFDSTYIRDNVPCQRFFSLESIRCPVAQPGFFSGGGGHTYINQHPSKDLEFVQKDGELRLLK